MREVLLTVNGTASFEGDNPTGHVIYVLSKHFSHLNR